MSAPNDGGPAFPCTTGSDGGIFQSGMSLRDWFAGMALGTLISQPKPLSITMPEIANAAYEYADTMLLAREQKEVQP